MLVRLQQHRVFKPWGRTEVPEAFARPGESQPLGELWFQRPGGEGDALLVKYLFTSERLSIQVHPDDEAARRASLSRGKDEAWLVLDAEPSAQIGIATKRPLSAEELREAALDGSVVDLIDWRHVEPGDAFYSPAGTVHSIGAGLMLLEVQQNSDVTYRLYDFGRPRELHLDEGISAAKTGLEIKKSTARPIDEVRSVVVEGPKFIVERWNPGCGSLAADKGNPLWLIPLKSPVSANGEPLEQPGVWIADSSVSLEIDAGGELLVAYEGCSIRPSA
ncbi:MAG TPA: class I mannose-6-phosphate isomerase [Sphingomicrobium sp.]|nr:class I mannose-6-phosphate isomerase [Sphingomicrobium sp.]